MNNKNILLHYIYHKKLNITDFNYKNYINNYDDLSNLNENEALEHYINYGYYENRTYKFNIKDFNYLEYINNYDDLSNLNGNEALEHYINYGYYENRTYKFNIKDFNYLEYINNYDDLIHLNKNEALEHYIKYGYYENRTYKTDNLKNFNIIDNIQLTKQKIKKLYNNKINFIDYILWINLDRSKDRNEMMNILLNYIDIPKVRITGIDGLDKNYINNYVKYFCKNITNFEIACFLSHIKTITYINNLIGKYFLILEDDISFNNLNLFPNNITLETIIKNAPNFDILLIYKTYNKKLIDEYTNWNEYYNNGLHIAGTVAYIINKTCINKILNLINYDNLNFYINTNNLTAIDYFLYKNLNTFVYKYNFITTTNISSLIHEDHLIHHKEFSNIQKKIILDDFT